MNDNYPFKRIGAYIVDYLIIAAVTIFLVPILLPLPELPIDARETGTYTEEGAPVEEGNYDSEEYGDYESYQQNPLVDAWLNSLMFRASMFGYLAMGIPVLIWGLMAGILGYTPGKFLFGLRVHNRNNEPPGAGQGIIRELVKVVLFEAFFFGIIWAAYTLFQQGRTFYDNWLGLDVDDYGGLTDTQKNWRKYHRNQ